jgi:hypothetical protein
MLSHRAKLLLAIPVLALGAAGCSTFDADWEAACSASYGIDSIEGPWQGTWKSEATGQTGDVRCIVSDAPEGGYTVRMHVKYALIFSGEESIPITIQNDREVIRFHGTVDQGAFGGGVLRYDGQVDNGQYTAKYRSRYDYGNYALTRP